MRHGSASVMLAAVAVSGNALAGAVTGSVAPAPIPDMPARFVCVRDGLGNVRQKLEAGAPVVVVYFGTSITWPDGGWRARNMAWFQAAYPKAPIEFVNAAIGATGSAQGVFRLREHGLAYKPDLVLIEFSINDYGMPETEVCRDVEGMVRQIWSANPETDIGLIHMYRHELAQPLREGRCTRPQAAHETIAEHYGLPSVNVAVRIDELVRAGTLLVAAPKDADGKPGPVPDGMRVYSIGDGVHPAAEGTAIIADAMSVALAEIVAASKPVPRSLKPPYVPGNPMERARMAAVDPDMLSAGWVGLDRTTAFGRLLEPGCGGPYKMSGAWATRTPGAGFRFRFRGTTARLYDIAAPDAGQIMVSVDGKTHGPVSRFNGDTWPTVVSLAEGLDDGEHEMAVTVCDPGVPDARRQAFIEKRKGMPDVDPKTVEGAWIRVARILVVGEMLPAAVP